MLNQVTIAFTITLTVLLLILVLFALSLYFMHRKNNFQLFRKEQALKTEFDKTIVSVQNEIQENTFEQISKDIHDNITMELTLAKLYLHTLDWSQPENVRFKVGESIDLLTSSIEQLRNISHSLNADYIKDNGLIAALGREITKIKHLELFAISYQIKGEPKYLSAQSELIAFRIFQESINNIIKYSDAQKVSISLDYCGQELILQICDDGNGFDYSQYEDHSKTAFKSGIRNMRARAELVDGHVFIDSKKGIGTTVQLALPIPNPNNPLIFSE